MKLKYYFLIFIFFLLSVGYCFRIISVNKNNDMYNPSYVKSELKETIYCGDVELVLLSIGTPLEKASIDYEKKQVVEKLFTFKVKNISDETINLREQPYFSIYEKYKNFSNLVEWGSATGYLLVEPQQEIELQGKIEFIVGDFFGYYDDYAIDKNISLSVVSPKTSKGTFIYEYFIEGYSE